MKIHALRCDDCKAEVGYSNRLPDKWVYIKMVMGSADYDGDFGIATLHLCPECAAGLEISVLHEFGIGRVLWRNSPPSQCRSV